MLKLMFTVYCMGLHWEIMLGPVVSVQLPPTPPPHQSAGAAGKAGKKGVAGSESGGGTVGTPGEAGSSAALQFPGIMSFLGSLLDVVDSRCQVSVGAFC